MNTNSTIAPTAPGVEASGEPAFPFFLSVGLRYEPIPDRQVVRALLCFGPFATDAEARAYLKLMAKVVNGGEPRDFTIARMVGITGGEPELVPVSHHRPLSFVSAKGHDQRTIAKSHDQRAIAQLSPTGVEQYLLHNGIGEVIPPYETNEVDPLRPRALQLLPHYILRSLEYLHGPRRVV